MRGEGEVPEFGFGAWGPDFFLSNLVATNEFFKKKVGYPVTCCNMKMFIAAVFYVANGETRVARIDPKTRKDKHGWPVAVELNFRERRRTVTWDAAVQRIFERPFLPSEAEVVECLGRKIPAHIRKGLALYKHYMKMRPNKRLKTQGSWEINCDILTAIANFEVPDTRRKD